jgi:hypothetical protein
MSETWNSPLVKCCRVGSSLGSAEVDRHYNANLLLFMRFLYVSSRCIKGRILTRLTVYQTPISGFRKELKYYFFHCDFQWFFVRTWDKSQQLPERFTQPTRSSFHRVQLRVTSQTHGAHIGNTVCHTSRIGFHSQTI